MAPQKCPSCGSPLPVNSKFCGQCGFKVASGTASTPPIPPKAPGAPGYGSAPQMRRQQPAGSPSVAPQAPIMPEPVMVEPEYHAPDNNSETTIINGNGSGPIRTGIHPQQPVKRGNNLWIGIGLGIIVLLLITGAVLYFIYRNTSKTYDYSDGENPEVEQEFNMDEEERDLHAEEVVIPKRAPVQGAVTLDGTISDFPFTMDLYIADDGSVSGQYWNVLYDISLPVAGRMDSDGNLTTTLGTGSSQSTLKMAAVGDNRYGGTWGKQNNIVEARMREGKRSTAPRASGDSFRIRIKGNGINKVARLSDNCFYYEDQGSATGHWLRAENLGYYAWAISSPTGAHLADIEFIGSDEISGIMTDISGKTFNVTLE